MRRGSLPLISRLPARDCRVPEQKKGVERPKNATEGVLATTSVPYQEDDRVSTTTSSNQSPQQVPQVMDSYLLGSQAKASIKSFKVFPPTIITPNTPECENYKEFVRSTLTRLVAMQASGVNRFRQAHEKISRLEEAGHPATPDLVSERIAAVKHVKDMNNKIDAIRALNKRDRRAWGDKSV
jgi:hypothetical protein